MNMQLYLKSYFADYIYEDTELFGFQLSANYDIYDGSRVQDIMCFIDNGSGKLLFYLTTVFPFLRSREDKEAGYLNPHDLNTSLVNELGMFLRGCCPHGYETIIPPEDSIHREIIRLLRLIDAMRVI